MSRLLTQADTASPHPPGDHLIAGERESGRRRCSHQICGAAPVEALKPILLHHLHLGEEYSETDEEHSDKQMKSIANTVKYILITVDDNRCTGHGNEGERDY